MRVKGFWKTELPQKVRNGGHYGVVKCEIIPARASEECLHIQLYWKLNRQSYSCYINSLTVVLGECKHQHDDRLKITVKTCQIMVSIIYSSFSRRHIIWIQWRNIEIIPFLCFVREEEVSKSQAFLLLQLHHSCPPLNPLTLPKQTGLNNILSTS